MATNNNNELIVYSTGKISKEFRSKDYCVWENSDADSIFPHISSTFIDCNSGGQLGFSETEDLSSLEILSYWEAELPQDYVFANVLPCDLGLTATGVTSVCVSVLGYTVQELEFPLHLWVTFTCENTPSWYIPMLSLVSHDFMFMPTGISSFLVPLGRQALVQQIFRGENAYREHAWWEVVQCRLQHLDLEKYSHWKFEYYIWLTRFKDLNL
jgi:hypothetical protein